MKKIRNRIFFQLLIPILAVYTIVIVGGIWYMGISFRESTLQRKQAALTNIVRGIDDWLLSRISEVVQLSRIPLFRTAEDEAIQDYLVKWRDRLSFLYAELYLIERDGSYWATDGSRGAMEDTDYPSLFFEEETLIKYAGPHRFGSVLKDHFVIGLPVYDADGSVDRVLTATIKLSTLRRIFGFFTFEEFDSWMVVNPFSIIITHADPAMSGLSERGEYGRTFLETEAWRGEEVFVQVMRNGWKVVAFLDSDKLMAPYRQAYALIGGFTIFLIIIVIVFVLILSYAVAYPIKQLNEGVHRIMAGDYGQKISIGTEDELADLAESFNRLASRMLTLRTDDRFAFLGHIAARMAHELRKPLHLIQLSTQALEGREEERERYIGIINQEIANADRFIGEILNFAHNESLDKQLYSPALLLERVVDKFKIIAGNRRITIETVVNPPIPQTYMDVIRMEEVFSNILQNAIDAIAENARRDNPRRIDVELAFTAEQEIHITFRDSGPGFKEELMDQFFDPYFTTREKGTGLGLSLSYRIVMAHGARITLANDGNRGGVVTIIFPL